MMRLIVIVGSPVASAMSRRLVPRQPHDDVVTADACAPVGLGPVGDEVQRPALLALTVSLLLGELGGDDPDPLDVRRVDLETPATRLNGRNGRRRVHRRVATLTPMSRGLDLLSARGWWDANRDPHLGKELFNRPPSGRIAW